MATVAHALRVGSFGISTGMNFLVGYKEIKSRNVEALGSLLRFNLSKKDTHLYAGVVKHLDMIDRNFREANIEALICHILTMEMLINDLKRLKDNNVDAFNKFRKFLRKSDLNSYDGYRFELKVASSLINKGVNIIARESPDFSLVYGGGELYAEARAVKMSRIAEGDDLTYKIIGAIREKSGKPYSSYATILFLDVTNLSFSQKIPVTENEEFDGRIRGVLNESRFGSLLIMQALIEPDPPSITYIYKRFDNECISDRLKEFMDELYPFGIKSRNGYYMPKQL